MRIEDHLLRVVGPTPDEDLADASARYLLQREVQPLADEENWEAVDRATDQVLKSLHIQLNLVDDDRPERAYMRPAPGGFSVFIKSRMSRAMFRFVLWHEVAHALAYDTHSLPPRRAVPHSSAEERMCSAIARSALLPREHVATELLKLLPNPDGDPSSALSRVARSWLVPLWQVVRRAAELRPGGDVVALLWMLSGADELTLKDAHAPRGLYVPVSKRSIRGSRTNQLVWAAVDSGGYRTADDLVDCGSVRGLLSSAAFSYPGRRTMVVQLLHLDRKHLDKAAAWRSTAARS